MGARKEPGMVAIVTCIDPRLTARVEKALGLPLGTAFTIRTAGAVFDPDGEAMRGLRLVVANLGVKRVCLVGHTDCRAAQLAGRSETEIVSEGLRIILADTGLPQGLTIEGYVLDLVTDALAPVPILAVK
jgi:carbonic anhydrase